MTTAIGSCARCESPLEAGDLRCAICAEPVPAHQVDRARTELAVEILRCQGCGAAIEYDAEVQAPRCAFCDSVMELERVEDPMEQTELWLPFRVDGAEARAAVKRWLGTLGWFRPSDLREKAKLEDVRPLAWVGWAFDAEALVSWTADSNEGSWRSAWAPHAGQVHMRFDDIVVSASRGLTEKEVVELVPHYAIESAGGDGPSSAAAPEEATFEQFDVQRSLARARVTTAIERMAASVVEAEHVPGSRFRKVRATPLLRSLVTRRYAFPAWVMAYRYEEKVYRAVVCGQDAACVVGKAPYSIGRILLAVFGGLLLLGFLVVVAVAIAATR